MIVEELMRLKNTKKTKKNPIAAAANITRNTKNKKVLRKRVICFHKTLMLLGARQPYPNQ